MLNDPTGQPAAVPDISRLLAYVADLELEVDRLRRQSRFVEQKATETLSRILRLCTAPTPGDALPTLAEVEATAQYLVEVVRDMHDPTGYHPAHDQVVGIAVRPLTEQIFRWQQRLAGAPTAVLRLDLETDHVEWFPARLRHILDNLFANALRYRDPAVAEAWVRLGLRATAGTYEIRVSDNGIGPPPGEERRVMDLFFRAGPPRTADLGVGLAVVKMLVEQSGGTLTATPAEGGGTDFVLTLPRYDLLDYLE
ncbi:MAG: hypothetical protein JWO38_8321 [Gemmataceae bacterium]|nr:hypothetical protein [Gemmataceae bacterium]